MPARVRGILRDELAVDIQRFLMPSEILQAIGPVDRGLRQGGSKRVASIASGERGLVLALPAQCGAELEMELRFHIRRRGLTQRVTQEFFGFSRVSLINQDGAKRQLGVSVMRHEAENGLWDARLVSEFMQMLSSRSRAA